MESEEQLQQPLADVLVEEATFTVNVWVKRSPFSRMLMEAGFKKADAGIHAEWGYLGGSCGSFDNKSHSPQKINQI